MAIKCRVLCGLIMGLMYSVSALGADSLASKGETYRIEGELNFSSPSTKLTGATDCNLKTSGRISEDGKSLMIMKAQVSGNYKCKMTKIMGLPWTMSLDGKNAVIKGVAFHVPRVLVNPPSDCGPTNVAMIWNQSANTLTAKKVLMRGECVLANLYFKVTPSLTQTIN